MDRRFLYSILTSTIAMLIPCPISNTSSFSKRDITCLPLLPFFSSPALTLTFPDLTKIWRPLLVLKFASTVEVHSVWHSI
jgi:hypothetical protein